MYNTILLFFLTVYVYVLVSLSSAFAQVCPKDFKCGKVGNLRFPFSNYSQESRNNCGFIKANCSDPASPEISLSPRFDRLYRLLKNPLNGNYISVVDIELQDSLKQNSCSSFRNAIHHPNTSAISFTIENNITMFKCKNVSSNNSRFKPFENLSKYNTCAVVFTIYYTNPKYNDNNPLCNITTLPPNCERITLPMAPWKSITKESSLFQFMSAEFNMIWHLSDKCENCRKVEGNQCIIDNEGNSFACATHGKSKKGVIIGSGVFFILVSSLFCAILIWYRKKVIKGGSYLKSRGIVKLPSSKSDLRDGSVYFGVPVFTYTELDEITNNFNDSNELGNGGFGTVYYGKLKDGREVAVKYLYEHNFKRMQQFKTEVEILTRLRHQNLVTLYGCTSRHSRDLLLVYEYVPNGTVADHLQGSRSTDRSLPWPIRMNIAIETADALAYLHASDIIHRDVKSSNILLDNNFCVKVADFGLSRLFPHDVTHISTAPQGTPGYVDPEYHRCYQLTDKSDVYSFGVVLIELISSMPAVDMSRKSHDINLSSFAINRIQRCAFDELIDPSLHIESNPDIQRMTTSVAELAFRCLQNEKEMRPTMEEVAVTLREIQIYKDNIGTTIARETSQNDDIRSRSSTVHQSPESEEVVLLRKKFKLPSSPTSVADTWSSSLSSTGTSKTILNPVDE